MMAGRMAMARSILAVDVGNSRIAMGCVIDEKVTHARRLSDPDPDELGDALAAVWREMDPPKAVAASSVSPPALQAVVAAAGERLERNVPVIGEDLPLPIETDLPEPGRIGTDRLCSAAMAYHRLQSACVVADFGTAVTIDCVSQEGTFLGGAILPGLAIGAEGLARSTACLPKVALSRPDWVFGADTRQAIVGGLVYGARGALRELTEAYATELGRWPPLILTGGDAELVGAGYDIVHAIVPDLCLMGIALAYQQARADSP
jgi:type III pantothenate kinase